MGVVLLQNRAKALFPRIGLAEGTKEVVSPSRFVAGGYGILSSIHLVDLSFLYRDGGVLQLRRFPVKGVSASVRLFGGEKRPPPAGFVAGSYEKLNANGQLETFFKVHHYLSYVRRLDRRSDYNDNYELKGNKPTSPYMTFFASPKNGGITGVLTKIPEYQISHKDAHECLWLRPDDPPW
ncbi:hypothetical protein HPP92_018156 [Vanilla planifolia]|uniref:Uncharacterized protein n=1 Tax=Vanilla planifolia TaxID=51239 RepID=A0A835QHI0_VANPL|nr:hypothetical protein HPP92_018156 [Vanilla planifolia]